MKNEFSGREAIVEAQDVVAIAKITINNLSGISDNADKELNMALVNLDAAETYLKQIQTKYDIALKFVPDDIKKQKLL